MRTNKWIIAALAVVAVAALMPLQANAETWVYLDYSKVVTSYTPGSGNTGTFSVTNDNRTSLAAELIVDGADVGIYADIFPAFPLASSFGLSAQMAVVNPAGLDNIQLSGTFAATDLANNLLNPQVSAKAVNGPLSPDVDGILVNSNLPTTGGVSLDMRCALYTVPGNQSILLYPLAGDWTFNGDAGSMSIPQAARDYYDDGLFAELITTITQYGDGTKINPKTGPGIFVTNADELFAEAQLHRGFSATGGDLKITVVPAPAALLLGVLGLGTVAWIKRRRQA